MIVVLDNLRSALNVGSIIRTCEGLGIKKIYFCGITPEIDDNKVLKTSLGAEKNIESTYFKDTNVAVEKLKTEGFKIVGLEITKNSKNIKNVKLKNEYALIIGNEVSGVSDNILKKCDVIVHIPMKGDKESFNVSVAFGITAYTLISNT